jgi:uncharacterized membrane protein
MDLPSPTRENLELLTKFDDRSQPGVSRAQRIIERMSALVGSPTYFVLSVIFIVGWVLINNWGLHSGWRHVDPPPYSWLQGIVSSNALLLTIAVLIRQNRMAQMTEHRSHLDLQINLLTEQKVTKILELVDEMRRNGVKDLQGAGPDSPQQAPMAEMTKPADPHAILDAIKEKRGDPKS